MSCALHYTGVPPFCQLWSALWVKMAAMSVFSTLRGSFLFLHFLTPSPFYTYKPQCLHHLSEPRARGSDQERKREERLFFVIKFYIKYDCKSSTNIYNTRCWSVYEHMLLYIWVYYAAHSHSKSIKYNSLVSSPKLGSLGTSPVQQSKEQEKSRSGGWMDGPYRPFITRRQEWFTFKRCYLSKLTDINYVIYLTWVETFYKFGDEDVDIVTFIRPQKMGSYLPLQS